MNRFFIPFNYEANKLWISTYIIRCHQFFKWPVVKRRPSLTPPQKKTKNSRFQNDITVLPTHTCRCQLSTSPTLTYLHERAAMLTCTVPVEETTLPRTLTGRVRDGPFLCIGSARNAQDTLKLCVALQRRVLDSGVHHGVEQRVFRLLAPLGDVI